MNKRILRTPEAADYVGLSPSTLEKMRLTDGGPAFVRLGGRAVGYDIAALDAWIDKQSKSKDWGKQAQVTAETPVSRESRPSSALGRTERSSNPRR